VHWHRNNGAARLFGGEQNAQGAGEEASSWRDKSVGLGRSGLGGSAIAEDADHRESCLPPCFCFDILCCVVLRRFLCSDPMRYENEKNSGSRNFGRDGNTSQHTMDTRTTPIRPTVSGRAAPAPREICLAQAVSPWAEEQWTVDYSG
jgi:hypothetical protein